MAGPIPKPGKVVVLCTLVEPYFKFQRMVILEFTEGFALFLGVAATQFTRGELNQFFDLFNAEADP